MLSSTEGVAPGQMPVMAMQADHWDIRFTSGNMQICLFGVSVDNLEITPLTDDAGHPLEAPQTRMVYAEPEASIDPGSYNLNFALSHRFRIVAHWQGQCLFSWDISMNPPHAPHTLDFRVDPYNGQIRTLFDGYPVPQNDSDGSLGT